MKEAIDKFSREDGFFYYTPEGQTDIPVRKVDLYDGATPSANAFMAHNLWICGMCMEQNEWRERAWKMLKNMSDTVERYSYSFGYWAMLLQRHLKGLKTIICAGIDTGEFREKIQENYLPEAYLLTSQKEISELPILEKKFFEGKMHIFVCTEQACLSPVNSVQEALYLLAHS